MRLFTVLLALLFHSLAAAQSPVDVHISSDTVDAIGRQFTYEIREKIRASNGLRLADRSSDALIRLNIVTLNPDENRENRTIYSIVFTARTLDRDTNIYLNNIVGVCGRSKIESCAQEMVAVTDSLAIQVKGIIRDAYQQNE